MKKVAGALGSVVGELVRGRPGGRRELADWVAVFCGLQVPLHGVCEGHCSPLDYLCHAFFEGREGAEEGAQGREGEGAREGGGKTENRKLEIGNRKLESGNGPASPDCIVWAPRGGGKTQLAAVATLLDLVFKPGIEVRILGGSREQAQRMFEHLRQLVFLPHFAGMLAAPPTLRGLSLKNGSRVEVLAQSDRSVRGQRVQRLRCDEVDLFYPHIWEAAQLTTRSREGSGDRGQGTVGQGRGGKGEGREGGISGFEIGDFRGRRGIRAGIEALSTMHVPDGLMQNLVAGAGGRGVRVFKWCVWDVVEACARRTCAGCGLEDVCGGKARRARGFLRIDDLMAMRSRVPAAVFETEMLCVPPVWQDAVFPEFDVRKHVGAFGLRRDGATGNWTLDMDGATYAVEWIAGVDFGFAGAFACVWVAVEKGVRAGGDLPRVWVADELVAQRQRLKECVDGMLRRAAGATAGLPRTVYCDPAGLAVSSHSGVSDVKVLKQGIWEVKASAAPVAAGLDLISALLGSADGRVRLTVHPRCVRLAAALGGYRWDARSGSPRKDNVHDHPVDALRYALVGRLRAGRGLEVRTY